MRITIPAVMVLSVLLLSMPVWVQAQNPAMQMTVPFNDVVFDSCNGELVTLTGEAHTVMHFLIDNSGGVHVTDILTTMGPVTGVGMPSGNLYKANETVINTANANGQTPQFEQTFVMSEVLISQGRSPNLVMHMTFHVTVNANGVPTANVLNMKTECTGGG